MSAIVNGIVDSTIGLVCNKIRDYTAHRLDDGDINDSELRQIVVRELDEIKTKLDGLSRKDLLASLSSFKEGVNRLYISLETSGESCEKSSTSQAHTEDDEPEGATAMTVKRLEGDAIDTALDLRQFIGNFRIASEERYQSSKKSFEEAKSLAMQAFNNTALSTEDRVMASKIRIASRILGCLDDPEAAVHDCLLYLKELQDLPAVQAMFTVWRQSKKGFISRFRARFNRTERNDMVESIQAITGSLLNLILQYTNMRTHCSNWPTIKIGKDIYHPILDNEEMMKEQYTKADLCEFETPIVSYGCAVTSTGKILSIAPFYDAQKDIKINKPNGESSVFYTIPSDNDDDILNKICCFAVDENDNVYIVIVIYSGNENEQYKLLKINENGDTISDRALDIIKKLKSPQMTVTKDGKLVIYSYTIKIMYICDSTNAEKDYKFPLPLKDVHPDDICKLRLTVSDQNEIICVFSKYSDQKSFVMYIITIDGELKHDQTNIRYERCATNDDQTNIRYERCATNDDQTNIRYERRATNVVFNHVSKTILVSFSMEYNDRISLLVFSKTGELLYEFKIPGWDSHQLTSHPNGPIALVDYDKVKMLQM